MKRTFTKYPSNYITAATSTDNLYSSNILYFDDQLAYKRAFKKKFGEAPFYFDNDCLVDMKTNKTIRGVYLNESTYKEFTEVLTNHFNLAGELLK